MDDDVTINSLITEMRSKAPEGILRIRPNGAKDVLVVVIIGGGCAQICESAIDQVEEVIQGIMGKENTYIEGDGPIPDIFKQHEDEPSLDTLPWADLENL